MLLQIKTVISDAEESLAKRNKELRELLFKPNATRSDLQLAQSKIGMGLKRKNELCENEEVLSKRKKEVEEELKL